MIEPLNDTASEITIRAIEKNLFEYSAHVGNLRQGQIFDSADIRWVLTNDPVFNRVLSAQFPDNTAKRVEIMVNWLKRRKLPLTWLISPVSQPSNLHHYLQANGLVYQGAWAGMAYDFTNQSEPPHIQNPALSIRKVNSPQDLKLWVDIACRSFHFSPHIRYAYEQVFNIFPLTPNQSWEFYLVYLNGQPVATGSLFYDDETAGIYWMATLPEYRNKGIGTSLASHLVCSAQNRNYLRVVLHATVKGYPVYQKVGFKEFCRLYIYTWKPRMSILTFSKYFVATKFKKSL
jgi:GNAT superfamily N-acetyltransferase